MTTFFVVALPALVGFLGCAGALQSARHVMPDPQPPRRIHVVAFAVSSLFGALLGGLYCWLVLEPFAADRAAGPDSFLGAAFLQSGPGLAGCFVVAVVASYAAGVAIGFFESTLEIT